MVLCLLVSIRFQVLFHSPPGVLFTVPSRYYSLSVTRSYLALGDGPPAFTPDFSCPVLLRNTLEYRSVSSTGLSPSLDQLSRWFNYQPCPKWGPYPVDVSLHLRFGLFPVRSPLLRKSLFYFLFLRVIRWFSSPGSPRMTMDSSYDSTTLLVLSFLIRTSAGLGSFAAHRSFSQLVTSFFGAMYQGILLYALCSLFLSRFNLFLTYLKVSKNLNPSN